MSIATELTRIQQAKADIKSAIEAKGVTVPSSATIDTYDDYVSQISGGGGSSADTEALKGLIDRSLTTIDIPSGVTSIGDYAFYSCQKLTSCTVSSAVTSIGKNAFGYIATDAGGVGLNLSLINLSGVSASTNFNGVFISSYLKGNITIPNTLLNGSSSGTSSTCYQLFNSAFCALNQTLTINIYANDRIIPRNMCFFNNASTINTGNINIIVYGTPTFLSRQSFRLISGVGIGSQSVTFADCVTPPNAENYGTSSSSPFYGFTATVYVPSAGLDAWKAKYTGIADKIQAIPS